MLSSKRQPGNSWCHYTGLFSEWVCTQFHLDMKRLIYCGGAYPSCMEDAVVVCTAAGTVCRIRSQKQGLERILGC